MNDIKFEDNHIKVEKELEKRYCIWLEEVAGEIESQAIKNTRTDTGETKKGWGHIVNTSNLEATVGNSEENSIWEEYGTGEYANSKRNVWYVHISQLDSRTIEAFENKYHYPRKGNFFKVHGKPPQRMLETAYKNFKPKAIRRFASIVSKG